MTQSAQDCRKLSASVEMSYGVAEEDVLWQFPLAFSHSTANVLEKLNVQKDIWQKNDTWITLLLGYDVMLALYFVKSA